MINVGDELPKGARYDTKKMIVVEENEKDEDSEHKLIENEVKGDRRTLDILTEMANTIDPDIRMSSEVPSDFSEGMLPFLDTQMWVDESTGKVLWKHYEKPMNSRIVMGKRSALDDRTKRTIHTQEVLRKHP